jgi:hypothetical protein
MKKSKTDSTKNSSILDVAMGAFIGAIPTGMAASLVMTASRISSDTAAAYGIVSGVMVLTVVGAGSPKEGGKEAASYFLGALGGIFLSASVAYHIFNSSDRVSLRNAEAVTGEVDFSTSSVLKSNVLAIL